MTLTLGTGPFAVNSNGVFNFEPDAPNGHVLYLEDVAWRIRAELAGKIIVDGRRAMRLHDTGSLPVYYFPMSDVRGDVLQESDSTTHCTYKGDARYWTVRVGDRVVSDALWGYPEPLDGSPIPADYVALYFQAADRWYEEDEGVFAHPRDPYHRVDVRQGSQSVTVSACGEVIVQSSRPRIMAETGLPVRYYLPPHDVRSDLLVPSGTRTQCPYKGEATYYSLQLGDRTLEDVVWSYHDTLPEDEAISGYFCFPGGDQVSLDVRLGD